MTCTKKRSSFAFQSPICPMRFSSGLSLGTLTPASCSKRSALAGTLSAEILIIFLKCSCDK